MKRRTRWNSSISDNHLNVNLVKWQALGLD
jgi:hypothetical protein